MKKIKKVIMILLIAVAIIGCKNQINVRPYEDYTKTYKNERKQELTELAAIGNYCLTEEDVEQNLFSFISSKDSSLSRTAVTEKYNISKIGTEKVSLSNIKSLDRSAAVEPYSDVNFYLYQITDNSSASLGYAVLTNDRRIGEIISVTDETEFSNDISDSPFMQMFCLQLERYIEETAEIWNSITAEDINKARSSISDIVSSPDYEYSILDYYGGNTSNILTTNWHQWNPYNSAIVNILGANYPAGCTNIAMAQIFAFHEYPKNCQENIKKELNNKWSATQNWNGNYNWNLMKSNSSASNLSSTGKMMVCALIYQIAEGMNSNYGLKETTVKTENNVPYLKSIGYNCDEMTYYDFNSIKKSIDNNCPVVVAGWSRKRMKEHKFLWWTWETVEKYEDGHTWVVDGYCNLQCKAINKNNQNDTHNFTSDFVHCNIGWGDDKNGYYVDKVFATTVGPVTKELEDAKNSRASTISFNGFVYNLKMITNIRPR